MEFKVLKNDTELEIFRQVTSEYIDVLLPLDYLQRSKVIACLDKKGKISGGMMFVMKGPFRVLESIPNFKYESSNIREEKTCEVTGLWLSSEMKNSYSARFWLRILWEFIISGKSNFVYAFTASKPKLKEIYAAADPITLYEGLTHIQPGMEEPEEECVQCILLSRMVLAPFLRPGFFIKRSFGATRLGRHSLARMAKIASK